MNFAWCTSRSLKFKWRREWYWILWKSTSSWWRWCEWHGSNARWWRCLMKLNLRRRGRRRGRRRFLSLEMHINILEKITYLHFIIHLISLSCLFQIMLCPWSWPERRIRSSSSISSSSLTSQRRYGNRFQCLLCCGLFIMSYWMTTRYVQWSWCRCRSSAASRIRLRHWCDHVCAVVCVKLFLKIFFEM